MVGDFHSTKPHPWARARGTMLLLHMEPPQNVLIASETDGEDDIESQYSS